VDDELKKAAGNLKEEDIQMTQGNVQKLVTADGTYASQSAFSTTLPVKKELNRCDSYHYHNLWCLQLKTNSSLGTKFQLYVSLNNV